MGLHMLRAVAQVFARGRESGATAVEYALIASLIAGVIMATVRLIGPALVPGFQDVVAGL